MTNYQAIVTRIKTRPIEGSDNIVLGQVGEYQVVVGKDTIEDALGVFFEADSQLSEELCRIHDLVEVHGADGKKANKGYFAKNRRVRAIKLRGVRSEGFWCPLSYFEYTGYNLSRLKEGDSFDELVTSEEVRTLDGEGFARSVLHLCTCNAKTIQIDRLKLGASAVRATEGGSKKITQSTLERLETIVLGTERRTEDIFGGKEQSGTSSTAQTLSTNESELSPAEGGTKGSRTSRSTRSHEGTIGTKDTECPSKSMIPSAGSKVTGVSFAEESPNSTSTTITLQDVFAAFSVAGVMEHLVNSGTLQRLCDEHLPTCPVRERLKFQRGKATLFVPKGTYPICCKYITPATRRAMGTKVTRVEKRRVYGFAEHEDTVQLKRIAAQIPAGSVIHLSRKLHGTAARIGRVYVERPRTDPWARLLRLFGKKLWVGQYEIIHGSRRVALSDRNPGWYGSNDFRYEAVSGLVPQRGEVLYGEIVGWCSSGVPIMSPQSTTGLNDKSIRRQFGDTVIYKYGQPDGTCKFYVYRITQMGDSKTPARDLSWPQVVARARELSILTVGHLETFIYDGDHQALLDKIDVLVNGVSGTEIRPSAYDPTHPEEGVVLRVETPDGETYWTKAKNFGFGILEGYLKEQPDFVDTEESA